MRTDVVDVGHGVVAGREECGPVSSFKLQFILHLNVLESIHLQIDREFQQLDSLG